MKLLVAIEHCAIYMIPKYICTVFQRILLIAVTMLVHIVKSGRAVPVLLDMVDSSVKLVSIHFNKIHTQVSAVLL